MKKLFEPDPLLLRPVDHQPTDDRAPDEIAEGSPAWLRDDLVDMLGADQVLSRPIDLIKYASDASPYRLFPKVIVLPRHVEEVRQIFAYAKRKNLPVTIRASGSSLSGQAQGDGILIEARRHWAGWTIEEEGRRLRVRPGTVLFRANLALAPHGYRLGPDPASGSVCTIGGVVANNSSGMCCGTAQNSYQTIESLTFLLPSGHLIDTAAPTAAEDFAAAAPELCAGLLEIKQEIEADAPLVERIRRKFSIKNTTGYHMESFLDADTPLEIFRRLLIGSEGTLAFLAEAVFRTVPEDKHRLTAFLIFPDMYAAAAAVAPFVEAGAAAVELTDRASLRSVEGKPGVPDRWRELGESATGLLIEFRENTPEKRDAALSAANAVLEKLSLVEPAEFTTDRKLAAHFWSVRNGLLPSVGGSRPPGTSLILEDVCFPKDRLADGAIDLQQLMAQHNYEGFVFGHASAGNLHFLITPSLNTQAEVDRYDAFMADIVALVVDKYDGSLKAEHGTGRNVAPFVVREWGPKLTGLMWKLKRLTDPDGILSPGVLLSEDVASHLQNLHTNPVVEDEVDRCVECGYCEPVCPSRNLSTTPRQRIVLRREMMRQPANSPVTLALLRDYEYEAIETCAGDGVCSIACPVNINTGHLMKEFRRQEHTGTQEYAAKKAAQNWSTVESVTRAALRANQWSTGTLGEWLAKAFTSTARAIVSNDVAPAWLPNLPAAASTKLPKTDPETASAVYFLACVNRVFGDYPCAKSELTLADALVAVSERAGMPVFIPTDVWGNCCATVWHSKGFEQGNAFMANKIVESLWRWSDAGRLPVVCDASSCTLGIASEVVEYLTPENRERHAQLSLLDSIDWAHDYLLPRLQIAKPVDSVAVHPTCATQHLGLGEKLRALCDALAQETFVPIHATCCGFAGDRGLLHPELTKAATDEQAAELDHRQFDAHVSSNRTCEIGLNQATGADYRSVIFLLEELTRQASAEK